MLLVLVFVSGRLYAQEIEIKTQEVERKIPSYSYNLKELIKEAEKNLKKVDEEIRKRDVLKENREKEKIAIEHFEKGNRLYQEGNLDEAKKEWKNVMEISKDPDMKDYIFKAERRAKEEKILKERKKKEEQYLLQRKISKLYKEGVSLYRYKKYNQALEKFTDVQKLMPGYAKTEYYLSRINKDTNAKTISPLYEEAITRYNKGELDKAESLFKRIISLDPTHIKAKKYLEHFIPKKRKEIQDIVRRREKEMQDIIKRKEDEKRQKEKLVKEKETEKKVDNLYKEGLGLYKEKKYEESYQKFQELQDFSPGYAKTEHYLRRIPTEIEKQKEWMEHQKEKQVQQIIQEIKQKKKSN